MDREVDLSTFLNEKCQFYQFKEGFRFGTDTFLLTDFVRIRGKEKLIDLGTGCGVIPILLLLRHPQLTAVGIDVLPENTALALKNAELNSVFDRFSAYTLNVKDVRDRFRPTSFDIAVSNPPFIEVERGSVSGNRLKAYARQEISANLADFIEAARYLLKSRGRFYLLLPVHRFVDAIHLLREKKLEPKRLRFIYPCQEREANLFLLESVKGGGKGLLVEPPLIIYKDCNSRIYTEEVEKKYGQFLSRLTF